jgi:hypothetical protein
MSTAVTTASKMRKVLNTDNDIAYTSDLFCASLWYLLFRCTSIGQFPTREILPNVLNIVSELQMNGKPTSA